MGHTSINLKPCCIKHTVRSFWYQDAKASDMYNHNVIKQNCTLKVVQSSIQTKNKATKRVVGVELEASMEVGEGGLDKISKRGEAIYRRSS